MNIDLHQETDHPNRPLKRADVEALLKQAGSSQRLVLRARNLHRVDLRKFQLVGVDLSRADLSKANLSEVNLKSANLRSSNFSNTNLTAADLTTALLKDANLTGANLTAANLTAANLTRTHLAGALLKGSELIATNLSNADLRNVDLSNADLTGAILSNADLTGAILTGANLTGALLFRTNLTEAILVATNLTGALLNETNLTGVDLTRVDLTTAHFNVDDFIRNNPSGAHTPIPTRPDDSGQNVATEIVPTFRLRLIEEPLTPSTLLSCLSAVTELATECWLIAHGRLADLIQYTQTHDVRFVKESHLRFTKITYSFPLEMSFKINLRALNVAEGITTAIGGITQAKQRQKKAKLENGAIEYALEIAAQTVAVLCPNADKQVKAMLIQTLLPTLLQAYNIKGLELILPPESKDA